MIQMLENAIWIGIGLTVAVAIVGAVLLVRK